MRLFNGKTIELLAPAGNFDIFQSIVKSKCDAIYFGGQAFNMRLIRKGYNFSNDELEQAVKLAHDHNKKAYITVNNLIDPSEIPDLTKYLTLLAQQIKPDAIIVQDFAILEIVQSLQLPLEIHCSVMMNVHNIEMINALKKQGVKRVVLSREMSLKDVRWIHDQTDIEIEYFTHGDMCIAHGSQCYYSSMVFGMSSNRGKCLKPCRWGFTASENDPLVQYPLAVKDLCLYPYLPEMIHAGVTSFKIEGRMREKEFITNLVNLYGDALDRFIEDPIGYDHLQDHEEIFETRKRDLSTAYAFGKPNLDNINTRYEGTGKFYSTGKMFSTPTIETSIDEKQTECIKSRLLCNDDMDSPIKTNSFTKLSVKVQTYEQAVVAIQLGVDRIYLAADVYLPSKPFTIEQIKKLRDLIRSKQSETQQELYSSTPRMMNELHFESYHVWLEKISPWIDGILVSNLGAIEAFKSYDLDLVGDFSLNIMNGLSAAFYQKEGLSMVTGSLELNADHLRGLCASCNELELVAQGRLNAMYFEHDFYKTYNRKAVDSLKLFNEAGTYEIHIDQYERTHLLSTHIFSILPLVEPLIKLGVKMFRIEAQVETLEDLAITINRFKDVLSREKSSKQVLKEIDLSNYSYGALKFNG